MSNSESLNIEYLIYKLELLIIEFEKLNQHNYIKRLNIAKTKLKSALKIVEKTGSTNSEQVQDAFKSASDSITALMKKLSEGHEQDINLNI